MRTLMIICLLSAGIANGHAQAPVPRTYRLTVDYVTMDLKGAIHNRERVSGRYTRDLPGGKVKWTDVTVARGAGAEGEFGLPEKRDFMEGFSYDYGTPDALKAEFFRDFPSNAIQERSLVWDTGMFELFGEDEFDKLTLNTPHHLPPEDIPLAGAGMFKTKDIELVLSGTSRLNGQDCALIDYRSFFNTFELLMSKETLVGRSHFWGQIWVSLATKRIEYATLYEDVLGEVTVPGQSRPLPVNVWRISTFEPARER